MQIKKRLAAAFAVCALALSAATPALAIPAATGDDAPVTTYQTDNVYVTKHLQTVKGVALDETFNFNVEKKTDIEGARKEGYPKTEPTVAGVEVKLDGNQSDVDANNFHHVYKQGQVDLSMFDEAFAKAHPGLYAYTISEIEGENKLMDYDANSYTLRVYCQNDGSRLVTVENNTTHKKVDPSKKDDQALIGDTFSGLAGFENKFMVSNDPSNPDDGKKQDLVITKVVNAGTYGFKDQKFTVKIKFHKPGQTEDTDYTEFQLYGTDDTLKRTFKDLPVGTTYEIVEVATTDWKGQGTATTTASVTNKEATVAETTENVELKSLIGTDVGNKVKFTNTFDKDVSITGLALNNAPFILMIGIPVVAGIVWVARRRSSQN